MYSFDLIYVQAWSRPYIRIFDLIYVQVDLIYLTLDLIYQILTIYLKTGFCPIWRVIVIVHEKFFGYLMYFSQKPPLFWERKGTNVPSRLKMCKVSQEFWRIL